MTGRPMRVPALAALAGRMSAFGIDDAFTRELGRTIEPGTSALFELVAKATTHRVVAEIRAYGPRVLKTSLWAEQADGSRHALADAAA